MALPAFVRMLGLAGVVATAEGDFGALLSWMQEGIDRHVPEEHKQGLAPLAEVLDEHARSFVARKPLEDGTLLMRLPLQRLMHAGFYMNRWPQANATLSAALEEALGDKIVHIAPQSWLALYMMEHRRLGDASPWSPYLQLLPAEFPELPVFYSRESWQLLEGSTFVYRSQQHLANLHKEYATIASLLPGFEANFTVNDFLWARSAISTRVFGWDLPARVQDSNTAFMVPLGDMFNHRSPKQLEWIFNDTTETFDYWVRENVSAGQELLISYGTKSNSEYLLHYGFTVPGLALREYPVCSVRLTVGAEGVPDAEAKRRWLMAASFSKVVRYDPQNFTLRTTWEKASATMLAHARFLVLPSAAAFANRTARGGPCKKISVPPGLCEEPLDLENERAALSHCLQRTKSNLAAYSTSLEEDEALLASGSQERLAASLITLRRDEKIVLHWWAKLFSHSLSLLDGSEPHRCGETFNEDADSQSFTDNLYTRHVLCPLLNARAAESSSTRLIVTLLGLVLATLVLGFVFKRGSSEQAKEETVAPKRASRKAKR